MVLLVVAAVVASSEAARVPAAVGNWTGEELRGAAARRGGRHGWRSRRRAFENGLGRTPQMGYVRTRRRRLQRCCYTFLRRARARRHYRRSCSTSSSFPVAFFCLFVCCRASAIVVAWAVVPTAQLISARGHKWHHQQTSL